MNKETKGSSKISVPSRFECHQVQLSSRQGQYPVHRGFPIVVADITFLLQKLASKSKNNFEEWDKLLINSYLLTRCACNNNFGGG